MAEEKKKFDINIWNTDPKHEEERTQFDQMVETSFNRIAEKKKKALPPEEPNFFDTLFGR